MQETGKTIVSIFDILYLIFNILNILNIEYVRSELSPCKKLEKILKGELIQSRLRKHENDYTFAMYYTHTD